MIRKLRYRGWFDQVWKDFPTADDARRWVARRLAVRNTCDDWGVLDLDEDEVLVMGADGCPPPFDATGRGEGEEDAA